MIEKKQYKHTERVVNTTGYNNAVIEDVNTLRFTNTEPMLSKGMMVSFIKKLGLMVYMIPEPNERVPTKYDKSFWILDQHGKLWVYGNGVYSLKLKRFIPEGEYGFNDGGFNPLKEAGCQFHQPTNLTSLAIEDIEIGPGYPVSRFVYFDNQSNKPWMWDDEDGFEYPVELSEEVKERLSKRRHLVGYGMMVDKMIDKYEGFIFNRQSNFQRGATSKPYNVSNIIRYGYLQSEALSPLEFVYPDHGYRGKLEVNRPYAFDPYFVDGWKKPVGCYYNPGFYPSVKTLAKGGLKKHIVLGGSYGFKNGNDVSNYLGSYYSPLYAHHQPADNYPSRYLGIEPYMDENNMVNKNHIDIPINWEGSFNNGGKYGFGQELAKLVSTDYRKPAQIATRKLIEGNSEIRQYLVLRTAPWWNFSEQVKLKQAINCNDPYSTFLNHAAQWTVPADGGYPYYSSTTSVVNEVDNTVIRPEIRSQLRYNNYFPYRQYWETGSNRLVKSTLKPGDTLVNYPYFGQERLDLLFTETHIYFSKFPEVFENIERDELTQWFHPTVHMNWSTRTQYALPQLDDRNTFDNIQVFPITLAPFSGANVDGYYSAVVENWGPVERKLNVPTVTVDTIKHRYFKMREKPFYGNQVNLSHLSPLNSQLTQFIGGGRLKTDIRLDVMGNRIWLKYGDIIYPESIYPVHLRGDHHYPDMYENVEHPRMGYMDHIWYNHNRSDVINYPALRSFYPLICINDGYIENGIVKGDVLAYNWEDNEYYRVKVNTQLISVAGPDKANFLALNEADKLRTFTAENKIKPLLFTVKKRLSRYHFPLRATFPDGRWVRHDASLFRVWMEFYFDNVTVKTLETLDMAENFMVENYRSDVYPEPHYVEHPSGNGYTLKFPWRKDNLMVISAMNKFISFVPKNTDEDIIFRNSNVKDDNSVYRVDIPFISTHPEYEEALRPEHRFKENEGGVFNAKNTSVRGYMNKTCDSKTKIHHGRKFDYIDNFGKLPLLPARTKQDYDHQDKLPPDAVYDWSEGVYKSNGVVISEVGIKNRGRLVWIVAMGEPTRYYDIDGNAYFFDDIVGDTIEFGYKDLNNANQVIDEFSRQLTFEELEQEFGVSPQHDMSSHGEKAALYSHRIFGEAFAPYFHPDKLIYTVGPNNQGQTVYFPYLGADYYYSDVEGQSFNTERRKRRYFVKCKVNRPGGPVETTRWFTLNFIRKIRLGAVTPLKHTMNLGFLHDPTKFIIHFGCDGRTFVGDPTSPFRNQGDFMEKIAKNMEISLFGHNGNEMVEGMSTLSSRGSTKAIGRGLEPHEQNVKVIPFKIPPAPIRGEELKKRPHWFAIEVTVPVRTRYTQYPTTYPTSAPTGKRITESRRDYSVPEHTPEPNSKYWHTARLHSIAGNSNRSRSRGVPNYMALFEHNSTVEDPQSRESVEGNVVMFNEAKVVKVGTMVRHKPASSPAKSSFDIMLINCLDKRIAEELVEVNFRVEISMRSTRNGVLRFSLPAISHEVLITATRREVGKKGLSNVLAYRDQQDEQNGDFTCLSFANSPYIWSNLGDINFITGDVNHPLFNQDVRNAFDLSSDEDPTQTGDFYNRRTSTTRKAGELLHMSPVHPVEITEEEYQAHWDTSKPIPYNASYTVRAMKIETWVTPRILRADNPLYSWREVQNSTSFDNFGESNKRVQYFKLKNG